MLAAGLLFLGAAPRYAQAGVICQTYETVCAGGCTHTSIQPAVNAIPSTALTGNWCIDITDSRMYSEKVVVGNKNPNGFRIYIGTTSNTSNRPTLNPPSASTAAFRIQAASVSIQNVSIISTNSVAFGVYASSAYLTISSVSVSTFGFSGLYWAALRVSSWSVISYSSVSVGNAYGIWLDNSVGSRIDHSSVSNRSDGSYTLHFFNASSNTLSSSYVSNSSGTGVRMDSNSHYNSIVLSTMMGGAPGACGSGGSGLILIGSVGNSIEQSAMLGGAGNSACGGGGGSGLFISNGSSNTFQLSTMIGGSVAPLGGSAAAGGRGVDLSLSSSNTFVSNVMRGGEGGNGGAGGVGVMLQSNSNVNVIWLSTMTGGLGSNTGGNGGAGLKISFASTNTIIASAITGGIGGAASVGLGGHGVEINGGSWNLVTQSSAIGGAGAIVVGGGQHSSPGGHGLFVMSGSSNTASLSVIIGGAGGDGFAGSTGGLGGNGVNFATGASSNTVSVSTISGGAGGAVSGSFSNGGHGLYVNAGSSNTVDQSYLAGGSGSGIQGSAGYFDLNSERTLVRASTLTASSAGSYALFMNGSSSNTITGGLMMNSQGFAVYLATGANNNNISLSSITSQSAFSFHSALFLEMNRDNIISQSLITATNMGLAVSMRAASSNTLTLSSILNQSGTGTEAIALSAQSNGNTVDKSTVNITGGFGVAIHIDASSANVVSGCYLAASTGVFLSASTGTSINSTFVSGFNHGVRMSSGSVGLSLRENTIVSNSGRGVSIESYNGGTVDLTSNSINVGGFCAICVDSQTVATRVWITSNTVMPSRAAISANYGLYLNGLAAGATIQNNDIYYRQVGAGAGARYALLVQESTGVVVDHNRINQPDVLSGGSYIAVGFRGVQSADFKFNDVYSSGTFGGGSYLLELVASTVIVRNNVFSSSYTAANETVFVSGDSGFIADFNNYFNATQPLRIRVGVTQYFFPWGASLGLDAHSANGNPFWANTGVGVEDFHLLSRAGRYNPATGLFDLVDALDSPIIDLGDPAEDAVLEPPFNGGFVNIGSYGGTPQASLSTPSACTLMRTVCKTEQCAYHTFQSAIDAVPNPLLGHSCVVVRDNATYDESVTVQNFVTNGSSLTIMLDPALSLRPTLSPSGGTPNAVFLIKNASVNIANIDISPNIGVAYGVRSSSSNVSISSVNVTSDPSNLITVAGVSITSWTTISHSSIVVRNATGLSVYGTNASVLFSTAVNFDFSDYALDVVSASSATILRAYVKNNDGTGPGAAIRGSSYTLISLSTITVVGSDDSLTLSLGAYSNTVSASYIRSGTGRGVSIESGSSQNAISQSTVVATGSAQPALALTASFNTVSRSVVLNTAGAAVVFAGGGSNTLSENLVLSVSSHAVVYQNGATDNTIALSTIATKGADYAALSFNAVSSNSIDQCYLSSSLSTAVYMSESSSNTISQSTVTSAGSGYSLVVNGGSYNRLAGTTFLNGVHLDGGAMYNAISLSVMRSNSSGRPALFLQTASSNTVAQCMIDNPVGDGLHIGGGVGAYANLITQSTMTSNAVSGAALYVAGASNTFVQNYIANPSGYGAYIDNSNYTRIMQSVVAGNSASSAALFLINSATSTFTQGVVSNASGSALWARNSGRLTVVASSISAAGAGVWLEGSHDGTIATSYVSGSTGVYVYASSRTMVNANALAGAGASGRALWLTGGSADLSMTSNTVVGGGSAGIYLDAANSGALILSTNVIAGGAGQYAVYAANQQSGSAIWITSNTILPGLSAAGGAYGVYLNGLLSGATIQNNGIYYRAAGASPAAGAYGLYANASAGIRIDHNRISNPGMISGAKFNAAVLDATPSTLFLFNDLHSTGSVTTFAHFKAINSPNAVVKNNILSSSMTATTNRLIDIDVPSQTGLSSDYNDFFSSNSSKSGQWGAASYSILINWQINTGQDLNSQSVNPLWLNVAAGVEDFHPLSTGGRWNGVGFSTDAVSSLTIDHGDVSASIGDETVPNGGRPNQGSYGQTAEASQSVLPCPETWYVRQAGGADATTIQGAIGQISNPLVSHTCVVIEDSGIYNEQVTVQRFTNNGSSITIMLDPSLTVHPRVNPPGASMAGFLIKNASVNIVNIDVTPSAAVSYGILASSPNVTVTSASIDSGGNISIAGVALSSESALSYSSITVQNAHGLRLDGRLITVSDVAAINSAAATFRALEIAGVSSNTVTRGFFRNASAASVNMSGGAAYNTMSWSTVTCNTAGAAALNVGDSSFNTFVQNYVHGQNGPGVQMTGSSGFNLITQSTVISANAGDSAVYLGASSNTVSLSRLENLAGYGLQIAGAGNVVDQSRILGDSSYAALYFNGATSNTVTGSTISNPQGHGVNFNPGSSWNSLSQSSVSSNFAGYSAVYLDNAWSNTLSDSVLSNPSGNALRLLNGAASNTISRSTMTSAGAGYYALYLENASFNTIDRVWASNPVGYGGYIVSQSSYNTLSKSAFTSNASGYPALFIGNSSSNTVSGSYLQGASALMVFGSTGTVVEESILVGTNTAGVALEWTQGSAGLYMKGSTLSGSLAGLKLDAGGSGTVIISTNFLAGGRYGLFIGTQTASARLWITSNTIVPSVSAAHDTYGLYVDGLRSGATIHDNSIVYRAPGSMGAFVSIGLYLKSASGLVIDHNRISNPGMLSAGSFAAVYFDNTTDSLFAFNDLHSTGTGFTDTYMLLAENSSVGLRMGHNVLFSSVAVSGSSATIGIDAGSQSGFAADFNNYFSSNASLAMRWGPIVAQDSAWVTLSGQDLNSMSRHPRWADVSVGVEDFHPLSQAGRWTASGFVIDSMTAASIDGGDSADDFSSETAPNGSRVNLGSYGSTAQASRSPDAPASVSLAGVFASSVSVSYASVAGDGYRVEASTTFEFLETVYSSATSNASLLSLSVQTLNANTTYYLRAGAVWGDYFASVNTTPASTCTLANPPVLSGVPFSGVAAASMSVTWSANANPINVTTYTVVLSTGSFYPNAFAANVTLSSVPAGGLPTTSIVGLTPNTTYFAFAAAVNRNGVTSSFVSLGSTSTLAADPLSVVSTFTAVTSSTVSVIWDANGNPLSVTTFTVQLSTASDFNIFATSITFTTVPAMGPSATFTNLTANTSYYFRLRAVNHSGIYSGIVALGSTTTLANPPLAATPSFGDVYSSSMVLTWQRNGNPADATLYWAAVSTTPGYPNADAASVLLSTSPAGAIPAATVAALTPNTTYFAFAAAVNHGGAATAFTALGSTSTWAALPASAVSTFSAVGSSSLSVVWSANGNPLAITTYTVQLSTASDFNVAAASVTLSTIPASGPSASFVGLDANTLYYLRVRAVNHAALATDFVNLGSTDTLPVSLQAPIIAGMTTVSTFAITATWQLQSAATGYTLVASLTSNNPPTVFASSAPLGAAATTATVSGLNPNTTYYMFVQANGPGAATPYSAYPATSTLAAAPASAVSTFSAVEVTSMSVSWSANGNPLSVTTYTVVLSTGASYPNSFAGNSSLSTMPAGSPSASLTGLRDNTQYYLHVAALNHAGAASAYASLGSTVTLISPPTAVVFDEISSHTIVASAYAPTPYFSNLGTGLSGTRQAKGAAYQAFHGEQWTSRTSMTTARGEVAAAAYNGKVYVFGGSTGGTPQTAVSVYEPAADAWTNLSALPSARTNMAAAVAGGRIYVMGGTSNAGATSLGLNHEYDPEANSWSTSRSPLGTARSHLSAAALGDVIYAFGGMVNLAASAVNERYSAASDSWTTRSAFASAVGRNRMAATAVAGSLAGRIYALGGAGPVGDNLFYDPGADIWTAMASMPAALEGAGAASLAGKVYVVGGTAGAPPVYEYDPASNLWAARASMTTGRSDMGVAAAGGRLYAIGGSAPDSAVNEEYDPGVATKFTGLTPNTLYSFKTQARNQAGTLSPETASLSTYTWAAAPSAASPVFTVVAADSATFQWGENGNPAGTQYRARMSTAASFGSGAAVLTTGWDAMTSTAVASLSANTTYYVQVQARNAVFIETPYVTLGSTSTLAAVPVSIASTFSAVGLTALTVQWGASANPLSITTYTVLLSTASDFNVAASSMSLSTRPAATPSATLTGLTPDTSYYLRVAALNHNGWLTSYTDLGSTKTLFSTLSAPEIAGFVEVGLSSISASWSLVSGATGYTLAASTLSTNPPASIFASSSPVGVSATTAAVFSPALNANTTYYLFVRANGAQSSSLYAAYPATCTLAAAPTSAVSTFSSVSSSAFSVQWNANGNPLSITTYTVQLSTAVDFNVFAASVSFSTVPSGSPSATFSSLTGNTSYYFRVLALNSNGVASAFVNLGSTSTLAAAPASAVSTFSAVEVTSMSVSWSANGNPLSVTTYTVVLSTGASYPNSFAGNSSLSTMPAGSPSASLTGLRDNTQYYLHVAALNHAGAASAYASLGSTVTLISPPTAVVFDEISSHTIVASAYAPTPYFSNLGTGLSGTRQAKGAAYQAFHGEQWTSRTSMTTARGEVAAAAYNGKVYVFGGSTGGTPQTAVSVYEPAADAWTNLSALPSARTNMAAAVAGGRIYVMGGTSNAGATSLGLNHEYDPEANSWSTSRSPLGTARSHLSAAALGDVIYAFGGMVNLAASAVNERYSAASDSWTTRSAFASAVGRNRMAATAVAGSLAGRIYALGGAGPVGDNLFYDPGADIWTAMASMPAALEGAGAASLAGKVYVVGGTAGAPPVYEYDPASNLWAARASMTTGRSDMGVAAAGGRLYAIGGSAPDSAVNEEYDPGVATKFTGLTPNTLYSFKTQARNQAGTLSPETASLSTYTWAAAPSAASPVFTVVAADSATFQWGENGNPAGTQYRARMSTAASFGSGAAVLTTGWDAMTSTAVASLSANTTYYVQVQARNAVFIETPYVTLGSTSTLAAVPVSIASTFSSIHATSMTVSWSANGNPLNVTTYTVILSTGASYPNSFAGNTPLLSTKPAGAALAASVSGLAVNTTYFAYVAALNANGFVTSFASLGSTSTMADLPKSAVSTFGAVGLTDLTVIWEAAGNALSITTYTVQLSTAADFNAYAASVTFSTMPQGAPTATFSGLNNNTSYYFRVQALNNNGVPTAFVALGSTLTLYSALAAPAIVGISQVNLSSMTASWGLSAGATGYTLFASSYPNNPPTVIAASSTTFDIAALDATVFTPPLAANTTYYLFVRANGLQTSSFFAAFPATATLAAVPATAVSTFGGVAANSLSVSWSANSNPASSTLYIVQVSTAADFNLYASSVTLSTSPAGLPSATLTGLSSNTSYYARVQAVNHNGVATAFTSLGSTMTLASPPAASSPPFGSVHIASMTTSWLANGNPLDVTTYSVVLTTGASYPNAFSGNTAVLSTMPAGGPPAASLGTLAANTTYFAYAAAHHMSGGKTVFIAIGSTATLADVPGSAISTFTSVEASSMTVSWTAGFNPISITTYTVELSTASDFNAYASSISFSTMPAGGSPTASFAGLSGLTTYYFRVKALNHNGIFSAFAELGSTRTLLNALPAPVLGALTQVGVSSLTASWTLVPGATGYTLSASTLPANPPLSIFASSTPVGLNATLATLSTPPLDPNTTYYLFVRANGDLVSSPYAAFTATSTLAAPPAAAAATFGNVNISSLTVSWNANGNPPAITTYTVQLSTAADFNTFATSVTFSTVPQGSPSATFSSLTGNTSYYLRVRAINHNGLLTAYVNMGSTLTAPVPLFATINNTQTGDAAWRRSNTGLYSVAFDDASGSHLDKFQVKASTTSGGAGADLVAFTDVVTGMSPSASYATAWGLPASVFNSLIEGVTNYISVRVFNGLGNSTLLQDAFYVLKDTTAPTIVDSQTGDLAVRSQAGTTYSVGAQDSASALFAFQYSASLTAASGDAALIGWTDIASVSNSTSYSTAWQVNFAQLASGVTNYISVRAWDTAGATTTLVDAFYVLKDTAGPSVTISSPTNASYLSSLGLIAGTARSVFGVQGTEVSVSQGGLYWNPAASLFNSASHVWMAASGSQSWSVNPGIAWADGSTYQVVARSSTTFNTYSATYATATFTLDSSTPTVAVVSPAPDSTVSTLAQINGTAADPGGAPSGLASVEVRLRRNSDGLWWNWFTQAWSGVVVSTIPTGTGTWALTPSARLLASLADGTSYFIAVRASDNALPPNQGDFFLSGATFTWQDNNPPSAIANLTAVAGSQPGYISLGWTAPGDDGGSGLLLTGQYRLFYSTDATAVASTAAAQVVLSTAMVNAGDTQSYTLTGLSAGVTYYLQLALADSDGNWSAFSNQTSTIAAPAPFDTISGHVVDLSTQGITAVQVDCWNASGVLVGTTFTVADGSGTYALSGLTPGDYKLKVTWTVNGVSSSLWQDGIAMGSSGVDFVLEINYALATLTGTLATLTTNSVGGTSGLAVAAAGAPAFASSHIELYQRGRQVAMARVQASGRWTIPSLLPGRYSVRAFTGLSYTPFQDVDLAEGEYKVLGFVFDPLPEASVFAFPNPARTATTIRFVTALAPLEADIVIFDLVGNVVREIPGSQINSASAPIYRAVWDLNNSRGQAVASGVYSVMVKIKGGSENQKAKVIKTVAVVR